MNAHPHRPELLDQDLETVTGGLSLANQPVPMPEGPKPMPIPEGPKPMPIPEGPRPMPIPDGPKPKPFRWW